MTPEEPRVIQGQHPSTNALATSHEDPEAEPLEDSRQYCPRCEYNLTGIRSERCPECGQHLDWEAIRREHDRDARRVGTVWERSAWYTKPWGFLVTAVQTALTPWILANQIRIEPRLAPALGFLIACMVGGTAIVTLRHGESFGDLFMWFVGVACQIILQTLAFGWFLRPFRVRRRFRFWFVVGCYTSYPMLLEGFSEVPYIVWEGSSIWPFSYWRSDAAWLTSLLFHLWWIDLAVIAWVRLPSTRRRRIFLILVAIPILTCVSSYAGCNAGRLVDAF